MQAPVPVVKQGFIDENAERHFAALESIVSAIRNIRGELALKPSLRLTAGVRSDSGAIGADLEAYLPFIIKLAGLESLSFDQARPKGSASTMIGSYEVYVPLAGIIDVESERSRLTKEVDRLERLLEGTQKKLSNQSFIERANPEIVENEKRKLEDAQSALEKVKSFLQELESLEEG
jgi:valyl-tRNA synthetase